MSSSRRFGRTYNRVTQRVSLVVGVVVGLILVLLSIPLWTRGDTGTALVLVIIGAAEIVLMVALWVFVIRHRGAEWRAKQDAATAVADETGHPRFFISGRAGIGVGVFFTAIGVVLLAAQIFLGGKPEDLILPAVLALVGVGALFAARAQRRGENSPR